MPSGLQLDESDHLLRLTRIIARAVDVHGDRDKASRWLRQPNGALGGAVPLELLDTDAGGQQVEQVLGRIEHGVVS